MDQPQSCDDCAFCRVGGHEGTGRPVFICNHRERDERLWGEDESDGSENNCAWFADREAVRCAMNGVET